MDTLETGCGSWVKVRLYDCNKWLTLKQATLLWDNVGNRGPEPPRGLNSEENSQRARASQRTKWRVEQSEGLSLPEDETQRGTVRGPELPRGRNAEDHLKTSDLLIIKEEFISDWCNNFRWNWRGKPINKTADSPVWSRNRQGRLHSDLWEKGKAYMCKKKKKKKLPHYLNWVDSSGARKYR